MLQYIQCISGVCPRTHTPQMRLNPMSGCGKEWYKNKTTETVNIQKSTQYNS